MFHSPVAAAAPSAMDWFAAHGAVTDLPVHFFAPAALDARLAQFRALFPGQVTYAVKANPADAVIARLAGQGMAAFDVASPAEIALIRRLAPGAALHYHNPVRSPAEIAAGIAAGVASWSVDCAEELDKLLSLLPDRATARIAVRLHLAVPGAAYNFGAKFGADAATATALLARVAAAGAQPAMTFHVGTQCTDPAAWDLSIRACADVVRAAGVRLVNLNVGGGFPASRHGEPTVLPAIMAAIRGAMAAFDAPPPLDCEPGRGLVGDAFAHAVRVKSLRAGRVYLNDGIYGGLSEFASMALPAFRVLSPAGRPRTGAPVPRTVFGPTCDSLDRLPGAVGLPDDMADGDWILFASMGAYLTGVTTRFNGYGDRLRVTVAAV